MIDYLRNLGLGDLVVVPGVGVDGSACAGSEAGLAIVVKRRLSARKLGRDGDRRRARENHHSRGRFETPQAPLVGAAFFGIKGPRYLRWRFKALDRFGC
jgi:hypothetical protein